MPESKDWSRKSKAYKAKCFYALGEIYGFKDTKPNESAYAKKLKEKLMPKALLEKSDKAKKPREYPERDLVHLPLMSWARNHPICKEYLIHIPNERKTRTPQEGMFLKAMGVKPGVYDLLLAYPANGFHGYWIELKAPGGKPTPYQEHWSYKMRSVGFKADYFDNWEKAKDSICDYLQVPKAA